LGVEKVLIAFLFLTFVVRIRTTIYHAWQTA